MIHPCVRVLNMQQDDPLTPWRAMIQAFLEETFVFHSLGVGLLESECISCGCHFDCRTSSPLEDDSTLYRCTQCGPFVECLSCCKHRHMRTPIHAIEVRFAFLFLLSMLMFRAEMGWGVLEELLARENGRCLSAQPLRLSVQQPGSDAAHADRVGHIWRPHHHSYTLCLSPS